MKRKMSKHLMKYISKQGRST